MLSPAPHARGFSTIGLRYDDALGTPPTRPREVSANNGNGHHNDYTLGTPTTRPREFVASNGNKFTVWPMSVDTRECNDVVHHNISIPPAVQVILDSPPVQRLVNLRQLGSTYNAYPCATHTRKEHSLGVMELAGKVGELIQEKQPALEVTDKDILCLRIAGLCHDLGHGPYSHVFETFLRAARKNEEEHPEQYKDRNARFKEDHGVDMPPLPVKYEHERTSLMMIDAALASVGLEIDWTKPDEPLRQIGNGTDREKFGVVGQENEYDPFTSRDWIFIKECVMGSPLDEPDAPYPQRTFFGRPPDKEFLYDIVSNRHNGLDVDKIDYYDRDSLAAFGSKTTSLQIFLRDARVARGMCPNPSKCFKCKRNPSDPGLHAMICYPKKHVSSAMGFFAQRMKNHEVIYTHKKTKAAELQMVDLLVEADKHYCMLFLTQAGDRFAFPVPSRFDGFAYHRLPISRAWMYPRLFLRMDDTISSIIEEKALENPSSHLDRLRQLLNDRRSHKIYKRVGEVEMGTIGGDEFWKMSEDEMKVELLNQHERYSGEPARYNSKDSKLMTLHPEDFIVEKRELHYGSKEKNPVTQMRFLEKNEQMNVNNPIAKLPIAKEVENLPMNTPRDFVRRTVRVFCRSHEKFEMLTHVFQDWYHQKNDMMEAGPNCAFEVFPFAEMDEDQMQQDSQPITQDEQHSCQKRKNSDDSESSVTLGTARKRLIL